MNAGDEIHYLELLKITKSRVSVKSESSRPTVDNHWKDVGDYFNVLNEQLIDKQ
jgi:Holliday junction resolvase RusA-like endonuclease